MMGGDGGERERLKAGGIAPWLQSHRFILSKVSISTPGLHEGVTFPGQTPGMDMEATLTGPKTKLRVFTLYADFPAAIRAKYLVAQMGRLTGAECNLASEMWKLDSVFPTGSIRKMIVEGAGESDVLLIAAAAPDQPDAEIVEWLNSLQQCKMNHGQPGLLLGLLGDEEHRVDANHWLVRRLGELAQETGMRFTWQRAISDSVGSASWLSGDLASLLSEKRLKGLTLPCAFDVTGK
jgi:hypothetical protein